MGVLRGQVSQVGSSLQGHPISFLPGPGLALAAIMPSTSPAPNATAPAAWTNISMPEMPLFHRFALLDEELYAAFPGLWLALMAVHGVIFLAGLVLNGLALYVFGCRTRAKTPSVM